MITPDQFYSEVMQSFRDINGKIDSNHKEIMPKIEDLCDRTTKLETEKKIREKNKAEENNKKYNHIFATTGIVGTVFGVIEVFKSYIWH